MTDPGDRPYYLYLPFSSIKTEQELKPPFRKSENTIDIQKTSYNKSPTFLKVRIERLSKFVLIYNLKEFMKNT